MSFYQWGSILRTNSVLLLNMPMNCFRVWMQNRHISTIGKSQFNQGTNPFILLKTTSRYQQVSEVDISNRGLIWQGNWGIMSNVKREFELYSPMCNWLQRQLGDKYKKQKCEIIVLDSHTQNLDSVLEKYGVINDYPQTVGLQIEIDVLGIVKFENRSEIIFIEAKKTALNLHDLGQLWAYCKLCNPADAYLLSSAGLGSLDKILKNLNREDMLDFGNGKTIKKMKVARWDIVRGEIDNQSIVPKL